MKHEPSATRPRAPVLGSFDVIFGGCYSQARPYDNDTEHALRRAGAPGMQVMDVGCGPAMCS